MKNGFAIFVPTFENRFLHQTCMNKQISCFDLTALSFELCLHKYHVSIASPFKKTKMLANLSNAVFWKKGWTIIHEKVPLFLDMDFLVNQLVNPSSNLA
jgi:hypothetical protein